MKLTEIKKRFKYEEKLPFIHKIYPRISKDSSAYKFAVAIQKLGPCTWKTIQLEVFKDKYKNKKNLTADSWYQIHGPCYGIDIFNKFRTYFVDSYKDPTDHRKVLYTLNENGKALIYCLDHIIVAKPKHISSVQKTFEKILKFYDKKESDLVECIFNMKNNPLGNKNDSISFPCIPNLCLSVKKKFNSFYKKAKQGNSCTYIKNNILSISINVEFTDPTVIATYEYVLKFK